MMKWMLEQNLQRLTNSRQSVESWNNEVRDWVGSLEGKSSWGWVALNWSVKGENFVINGAMKLTLTAIVLFKHILLSLSVAQLEHECKTVKNDRDIQLSQLKCKYQQQWQKLQAETDKKVTLLRRFQYCGLIQTVQVLNAAH